MHTSIYVFYCWGGKRFHPLCGAVRVVEVLKAGGEETGFGAEMAILCETHVDQARTGGRPRGGGLGGED